MTVSTAVRMALAKANKTQAALAESLGIHRQSVNLKLARESWTCAELAKVAAFTGGRLAILYPDGQQILVEPAEDKPKAEESPE